MKPVGVNSVRPYNKTNCRQICKDSSTSRLVKNVKQKHLQFFSKNPLDKRDVIAYNKSKESIPVDGLLPLQKVKE